MYGTGLHFEVEKRICVLQCQLFERDDPRLGESARKDAGLLSTLHPSRPRDPCKGLSVETGLSPVWGLEPGNDGLHYGMTRASETFRSLTQAGWLRGKDSHG
jgi:hypothetical protein